MQTATAPVDTTSYTYDPSGNITSVSDAQNTGATDTQCFTYNDLDQLTTAWTDTGGTSTAAAPSVSGVGGCATATPSAATIGGPSPYWESWSYDPLGDRTAETAYNTSGDAADNVTQTLTYPGGDGTAPASGPSEVSSVATAGPGGTTTTKYNYDADGDTIGRVSTSAGASPPAGPDQTFGYDPEGQVDSVTTGSGSSAQTSSYLYDAGGNLLIQRDPGTTTLYLDNGAEQLQLNTATGAVSGLRYYAEPDGTTVVRSSSGAITYELSNQQGTDTEVVSASTLAVTRRYYDPYGDPRGSVPGSWVDNRGFLDQPADATTGLDLLGSRQYDPVTGRFLSVDPVLEAGDARQMGGYSYAADNPASGSDPSGDITVTGGGCVGSIAYCTGSGGQGEQNAGGGGGAGGAGGGGAGGGGGGGGGSSSNPSAGCWGPGGEWLCGTVVTIKQTPWHPDPAANVAIAPSHMPECVAFFGLANCLPPSIENMVNGHSFGSGLIRKVGQITGVTDAINCAKNPQWGTCLKAAIKLTITVTTIATLGASAPEEIPAEEMADAAVDTATSTGADSATAGSSDATTSVAGDGATSSEVATPSSGEAEPASKWQTVKKYGGKCVAVAVICAGPLTGWHTGNLPHNLRGLAGAVSQSAVNPDADVTGEGYDPEAELEKREVLGDLDPDGTLIIYLPQGPYFPPQSWSPGQ